MSISKKGKGKTCNKNAKDEVLRPRTAYNFFYRYQRDLILKSKALSNSKDGNVDLSHIMPDPFTWCANDSTRRKRPHRKTHGLIGLQQLTKTVAKRWKEADVETKNKFIALAAQDKIRYKNETLMRPNHWMHPYNVSSSHPRMPMQHFQYPQYIRGGKQCYPMAVQSSTEINNYPYETRTYGGNRASFEPMDFKKRSNFTPMQSLSNPDISCQYETPINAIGAILSAEEYDMLELLMKE